MQRERERGREETCLMTVTLCKWENGWLCDDREWHFVNGKMKDCDDRVWHCVNWNIYMWWKRVKRCEWEDEGLCDDRVKQCEWEDDCVTTESDTVWMDFLNIQDCVMAESETVWMGSWRIVWSQRVTLCRWEGKGLCDREWHCADGKIKDCVTENDTVWMGRWRTVWWQRDQSDAVWIGALRFEGAVLFVFCT